MASAFICEEIVLALDCIICGSEFSYRRQGAGRPPKFCSKQCRKEQARRASFQQRSTEAAREKRAARYAAEPGKPFTCKRCGEEFLSKQAKAAYCSPDCLNAALAALAERRRKPRRRCAKCQKLFKPNRVGHQQRAAGYVQKHCSYECAGRGGPRRLPNRKKRSGDLRKSGYWLPVDPIKVFERDGWRCHLCKIRTPKRLRGTTDDRAPELDHIIPIAAGGKHTYENTACACRLCNRKKGSKPLGQLLLFG